MREPMQDKPYLYDGRLLKYKMSKSSTASHAARYSTAADRLYHDPVNSVVGNIGFRIVRSL